MIAKGNRTQAVTDACKKHGGFYLGTIGGVAAALSAASIKSIKCIEYPELGMEAVYEIEVEDFTQVIFFLVLLTPRVYLAVFRSYKSPLT